MTLRTVYRCHCRVSDSTGETSEIVVHVIAATLDEAIQKARQVTAHGSIDEVTSAVVLALAWD